VQVRLQKLTEAVGHVSAAPRHVVVYLCRFLALVANHSAHNQMNTENLARVFAPLLLRWKGELTVQMAEETPLCIAAVSALITHHATLFSLI
jgi:RhoGAP domain